MAKATAKKKAAEKAPGTPALSTGKKEAPAGESKLAGFFTDGLKDIYWAENHLTKALPKMIKAACSPRLKKAFADHLAVTKVHVERLEEIFGKMGVKAQAKKCDAMEGISKECEGIIEDTDAGTATRDVGLIMGGQKTEHYEIATYGGLAHLAETLGKNDIAEILLKTLQEEKDADLLLSDIAKNDINYEASEEK